MDGTEFPYEREIGNAMILSYFLEALFGGIKF